MIIFAVVSVWPGEYLLLVGALLFFMAFEMIDCQKRIALCCGELQILQGLRFVWQGEEWHLAKKPWLKPYGALVQLHQIESKKRCRLWLAVDSMSREEWRNFYYILLNFAQ